MTYLVERLVELRRHLDHLRANMDRVIEALDTLDPVEQFAGIVRAIAESEPPAP